MQIYLHSYPDLILSVIEDADTFGLCVTKDTKQSSLVV